MWNEIVTLFSEMGTLSIVFLIIGMILAIIEVAIPGFGIFGIISILMTTTGVVFRIIAGISVVQLVLLVLLLVLFALLLFSLFIYSARYGMLGKIGIAERGSSISPDYASDEKNYAYLLGKQGVTTTICKPVGKVLINNLTYEVLSSGAYLPKGTYVKVIEVDGANIIIKKI